MTVELLNIMSIHIPSFRLALLTMQLMDATLCWLFNNRWKQYRTEQWAN